MRELTPLYSTNRPKLLLRSTYMNTTLLTDCASVHLSVHLPFRPHIDILVRLLEMFLRVRAWTAGRRVGSHAFWESDVTPSAGAHLLHIAMHMVAEVTKIASLQTKFKLSQDSRKPFFNLFKTNYMFI